MKQIAKIVLNTGSISASASATKRVHLNNQGGIVRRVWISGATAHKLDVKLHDQEATTVPTVYTSTGYDNANPFDQSVERYFQGRATNGEGLFITVTNNHNAGQAFDVVIWIEE